MDGGIRCLKTLVKKLIKTDRASICFFDYDLLWGGEMRVNLDKFGVF